MQITLNKANKLLEKLKSEEDSATYTQVRLNVLLSKPNEVILKEIEDNKIKLKKAYNEAYNVNIDRTKLKQAIFATNVKCGLSDVLSQIDLQKKILNIHTSNLNNLMCASLDQNEVTSDFLNTLRENFEKNNNFGALLSLSIRNDDEKIIVDKIKSLRKEISQLEDRKALLNAETKIDIEFEQTTQDLLGL